MKKAFIMPLTLAMMAVCACTDGNSKKGAGLDMTDMDTSVAAQEDFYKYACGGWIKNNPLTAEYARFGSFDQLRLDTQEQLRDLVEGIAAQENEKGSVAQKIADVYSMKMDSTRRNELGAAPIQADLAAIDAISTREDLTRMVVSMNKEGVETFFGIYIGADAKNSSMNILDIYQGGTNMGDRDYYLEDDETTQEIQQAYREYIKKLFILAGCDEARAERAVESVMKIETGLARVQFSREEQRDPQKNYNKMTVKEFKSRTSAFDWDVFFTEMGYDGEKELVVDQLPFIDGMDKVIKGASMDEIKDYLAFNLLDGATSLLSDDFEVASFEFYGKTLSGTEVQQPRWKRALGTVNGVLSEAVGQIYVEKYFPASSKERMVQLVKNLQVALGEHINALEWMGDSTKAKAQEKLSTFHVKIGYPDKWEDYSELEINPELSLYDNMKAVSAFFYQKN
ncbi:MAG: hypothetical protein IIY15_01780, partial [Flavobacteriales bacterium]|nr:hypothetical protein [Flavobacteriales bacterium]